MKNYDIIVVGTGGATLVADAAQREGKKVAIIDKGKFGGTCANRGCIPTKVMATAADSIQEIKEMKKIGVNVGEPTIDWDIMSKRVWNRIDLNVATENYYRQFDNVDVYKGVATFTGEKTMVVKNNDGSEEAITAPIIIIGTGGYSKVQPIPGLEEAGYMTSESLFGEKYPKAPFKSLIVFGGGPIGAEFAHVFNSAGTKVTLVQHNKRMLPKEDHDVSQKIYEMMVHQGIDIRLNQETVEVRVENGEKVVVIEERATGERTEVRGEEILVATGIKPSVEELKPEVAGIEQLKGGWIKTNEFLETSVEGIYALGDVNGEAAFRHRANYEGDIIAHNLYYAKGPEDYRWARYDLVPAVTFTYPNTGHVGLTEEEAKKAGYDVGVGINHYSNSAKGFALGLEAGDVNDGFVKVVVDKATNRLLGAHVIGPQAAILFQPYVHLMNSGEVKLVPIHEEIGSRRTRELRAKGLTRYLDPTLVTSIGEAMAPHPTLSEVSMWTQVFYEHRW